MKRRLLIAAFTAACLAVPAMVYAYNSNPLCNAFEKYSLEWYVLLCNLTEAPNPPEG